MKKSINKIDNKKDKKYKITNLLKPYSKLIFLLVVLSITSNALTLSIPQLISHTIDNFNTQKDVLDYALEKFLFLTITIFLISYVQGILQAYISEKAAKDLRENLINKISEQSYIFVQEIGASKLLTRITLDIDNIKLFISQAIPSLISSIILIFGSAFLLINLNWKLAICILMIIPAIAILFIKTMKKVRVLFKKAGEIIDKLNKVINENIIGSSLIRILNSQNYENNKFLELTREAKENGIKILLNFAFLMPSVIFISNLATLIIFSLGGYFVIKDQMTLGDFSAFNGYLSMLFFSILLASFMSNLITQASASYLRIGEILEEIKEKETGTIEKNLTGTILVENLNIKIKEKNILKNINFEIKPLSKTAIIGPTGAGKTQLLYLITGLIKTNEGKITFDNVELKDYKKDCLYNQIALVFQDNIMFNSSIKENICFDKEISEEKITKALKTSELYDFVESLPEKLNTNVTERGTSLSGGQKQRIMLARALILEPKILFLDDFTARVDFRTEQKIIKNLKNNYPNITLVSVTQNIDAIKDYDEIILLMEGELIDKGKHEELMKRSVEYVQIYNSQKSTNTYELHTN